MDYYLFSYAKCKRTPTTKFALCWYFSELYRPISVSLDLKTTAVIDQAFEPEVLWLMVTVRWNCKIMKAVTRWQDWFAYGDGRGIG